MDGAVGPAPAGSATAPAPSWSLSSISTSGLTAAAVVLLLLYITGRFLWQYNKIAAAEAQAASAASSSSSSSLPVSRPRVCGGEAVSLSLLPVFVHVGGAAEEKAAECAVCLAEFGVGQAGRALPRCGHGFHEDCIATWLRLNTTCPLCRAPVVAANSQVTLRST